MLGLVAGAYERSADAKVQGAARWARLTMGLQISNMSTAKRAETRRASPRREILTVSSRLKRNMGGSEKTGKEEENRSPHVHLGGCPYAITLLTS